MSTKISVVGGGLAGLAAALRLAEEGQEVSLFERRGVLGGRASSFLDPATGEWVDNCQHVSMRCCTNLQDFFRRIDAVEAIQFSSRIPIRDKENRNSSIHAWPLPAPLHLFPSLLRLKPLNFSEKINIVRAMWKILRERNEPKELVEDNFLSWLRREKQSERAIRNFWEPLLVSALNEEIGKMAASAAIFVIYETMLKNRRGYEVGLPSERLSAIYSERAQKALEGRGVRIYLNRAIAKIREEDVVFQDGEIFPASRAICTVPFHQLMDLLPDEAQKQKYFSRFRQLESSPITGIHLWFDRPITEERYTALLERHIQWVFTHEKGYVSLVVSASRNLETLSKEEVLELSLGELREVFPRTRQAKLLRSKIIRERAATFSISPQSLALRPDVRTPWPHLYLAGDWTNTGWPATMEGAVRSGYLAAQAVLEDFGKAKTLLQPALRAEGLSFLFKKGPGSF